MTNIQELYICLGIFAMIILAIQLVLIFFGPERKISHDETATPFALRSITAYISVFGWAAFVFTFCTHDLLAFFGGFLIAYIAALLVYVIFKKDFIDAFEEYTRKKRGQSALPKQITMDEALKQQEEKLEEPVVVKELTYEATPVIATEEPAVTESVKEETVIEVNEVSAEPEIVITSTEEIKPETEEVKVEESKPEQSEKIKPEQMETEEEAVEAEEESKPEVEQTEETTIEEPSAEIEEETIENQQSVETEEIVEEEPVTEDESVIDEFEVKEEVEIEEEQIPEEEMTEEEKEIQDLLLRLKGNKS